jgi:glycosyltransferase involved in cell wall biosynthesis
MAEKPRISIVIPAYNEAPCLGKLHEDLAAVCDSLPYHFEFLFVNDGSTDETDEVLAQLRSRDVRVRYLVLSRNFGHQGALSAGLAFAAGDAVIMMDGDLQHPPSVIPRLIECWEAGFEVVNTIRVDTEDSSLRKKLFSRAFYWVFKALTGFPLDPGSADFRLMSRDPVDALNGLPERHRFIRGLVPWLGFRQTNVTFRASPRWAGRPKYTFRRSLRLALEGMTAFSLYPLRLVAVFGLFVMAASFGYGLFALCWQALGGQTVKGWTSLIICVHFFGGCQLATIGILSEYLGRTLDQVKGRPVFIVRSACGAARSSGHENEAIPAPHFPKSTARMASAPSMPGHDEFEQGGEIRC